MAKAESPVEPFKRALAAAMRAVANEPELQVTYAAETPILRGSRARLPLPSRELPPEEVAQVRGTADAMALKLRYHDEKTHARLLPVGGTAPARNFGTASTIARNCGHGRRCRSFSICRLSAAATLSAAGGGATAERS